MIECMKFKSLQRGTLQGFADLELPNLGIQVFGCSVHQKNGQRWVNLPSKEYETEGGEKKYLSVVRFIEGDKLKKFSEEALKAVDKKCASESSGNVPF